MKIIKADATKIMPDDTNPYKFMEMVGRTCYKSENNITDESAVKFVHRLKANGHTAMLEHAHIILNITDDTTFINIMDILDTIALKPYAADDQNALIRNYFNVTNTPTRNYLSGSFRAFIMLCDINANNISQESQSALSVMKYVLNKAYPELFECNEQPNEIENASDKIKIISRSEFKSDVKNAGFNEKTTDEILMKHLVHTIKFTCDRGVTHEFVRHRPASFAQESTRYCNYSKEKFGKEITVIEPCFWDQNHIDSDETGSNAFKYLAWKKACEAAEKAYFDLLDAGATPQEARDVLPQSVKTELIITANEKEWQHIINLRYHGTTGAPHPQMIECMAIATPMLIEMSDGRLK